MRTNYATPALNMHLGGPHGLRFTMSLMSISTLGWVGPNLRLHDLRRLETGIITLRDVSNVVVESLQLAVLLILASHRLEVGSVAAPTVVLARNLVALTVSDSISTSNSLQKPKGVKRRAIHGACQEILGSQCNSIATTIFLPTVDAV